jgi:hypothetical protein
VGGFFISGDLRMTFTDQVRAAIRQSGHTRYRLARESQGRLHESELSRFLTGRGNLGLRKLDVIAEMVGLTVAVGNDKTLPGVNLTGS